jgi:hypothetical protein
VSRIRMTQPASKDLDAAQRSRDGPPQAAPTAQLKRTWLAARDEWASLTRRSCDVLAQCFESRSVQWLPAQRLRPSGSGERRGMGGSNGLTRRPEVKKSCSERLGKRSPGVGDGLVALRRGPGSAQGQQDAGGEGEGEGASGGGAQLR